jgi:F-type H+-transporting ATPase subunit b
LCLPAVVFAAGPAAAGDHGHEVYFGFIPGWVLKLLNMALFIGLLVFLVGGPVKKAFAARSQAIRAEAEEAKSRRAKADQMAGDIQNRLTQIEQEIVAIRQRAEAEGERQRRELVTAAEAEAAKILQSARNEVDNRLKHAREELTQYAGQLASERAEQILRERMTDGDRTKLFNDSLKEIEVARS